MGRPTIDDRRPRRNLACVQIGCAQIGGRQVTEVDRAPCRDRAHQDRPVQPRLLVRPLSQAGSLLPAGRARMAQYSLTRREIGGGADALGLLDDLLLVETDQRPQHRQVGGGVRSPPDC